MGMSIQRRDDEGEDIMEGQKIRGFHCALRAVMGDNTTHIDT